jgi:hypothetical protein
MRSSDPIDALLRQGLTHKDAMIRAWARKLLGHGDRREQRAKRPRRRPVPPAAT